MKKIDGGFLGLAALGSFIAVGFVVASAIASYHFFDQRRATTGGPSALELIADDVGALWENGSNLRRGTVHPPLRSRRKPQPVTP